jgi:dephospho-CoA kinase
MLVVGLTGGMGSGKSTVGDLLAERGAVVISADEIVHELLRSDDAVVADVVGRFGFEVLDDDGAIDRSALAAKAFGDPSNRADLEAILWPRVRAALNTRLQALEADGVPIVVVEIPLLVESGRDRWILDHVVVVDSDIEIAIERLAASRSISRDEAESRIAAQATRDQRAKIADSVIDNSGPIDNLEGQVAQLWSQLEAMPA